MHSSDALRYRAQRAGVSHFIVKSCTIDEIVKQLDAVMNNESMSFCATNTQEIERAPAALSPDLSARELEVLALIACEELTTKEIAERLHRSVQTIETHRAHLFQKLGVDSVVGLVKYAMSSNLCSERSNDHHSGSA